MKCELCRNDKNRSWLRYGIITGFFAGLFYFVIGVYQHSHSSNSHHYFNNSGSVQ